MKAILKILQLINEFVTHQGSDHLTVTWKVADGSMQHIDVREEGKENAFSLGSSLFIGKEVSCRIIISDNNILCNSVSINF